MASTIYLWHVSLLAYFSAGKMHTMRKVTLFPILKLVYSVLAREDRWVFKTPPEDHTPDTTSRHIQKCMCLKDRCDKYSMWDEGAQLGLGMTITGNGSVWMSGERQKRRQMDGGGKEQREGKRNQEGVLLDYYRWYDHSWARWGHGHVFLCNTVTRLIWYCS